MLIYDCEIIKAIPPKNPADRIAGIDYADGWKDFANMGISVICTYDYTTNRYGVFLEDNFGHFEDLVHGHPGPIVGFNSLSFDNRLCAANGIAVPDDKSYDLLVEIWAGAGLGPDFAYPSHIGYGLGDMGKANLGLGKTGDGALAPVDWQQGRRGKVISYCLDDIWLTRKLLDKVLRCGQLISPKNLSPLKIRRP